MLLIFFVLPLVAAQRCEFFDLTDPVASILCSVETGQWSIWSNSSALSNAGCLLGGPKGNDRCQGIMKVPTEEEVPPSDPPPEAKNKRYQELATAAEAVVPKTWWRAGFSNDALLLSRTQVDLPRKQFDERRLSNKKLKNLYQCATRQNFIRKAFDYSSRALRAGGAGSGAGVGSSGKSKTGKGSGGAGKTCNAHNEPVVQSFFTLWDANRKNLGGGYVRSAGNSASSSGSSSSSSSGSSKDEVLLREWLPDLGDHGKLLVSALEVLEYFYANVGGIWTGCFKLTTVYCRGALAAASLVVSMHLIADIAGKHKVFVESDLVRGYILASLGRGVLHGDTSGTGVHPISTWNVRLNDFIAMQAAFMKLYIESFGAEYTKQLNTHVPQAFSPNFPVHKKQKWARFAHKLEPVYTSLRNWMFTESSNLIDFGPYRPLAAFEEVRKRVKVENKRRVLVDVGANGFFASPKYLLDSYAPYLPFTHAIMIEPEPHFSATIPEAYSERYNISFLQIYAEVATGGETDMLQLLPKLVTVDDFVVLKFDVDPNRFAYGPTMEWGFLFSIMKTPDIARLVDEVYIELHFHFPSLFWSHYHSNWEALDAMRYLRDQGAIVHSWP